jgi:nitrile hydratase accessory protein
MSKPVSELVSSEVRSMQGAEALPRSNGEIVFAAPWQGRVFGLAVALVRARGWDWDEFRKRLIAAIAAEPGRPYFESWTAALETLIVEQRLADTAEVASRAAEVER